MEREEGGVDRVEPAGGVGVELQVERRLIGGVDRERVHKGAGGRG